MSFDGLTSLPPPPLRLLQNAALFLDLDGTLLSLAERPDLVRVDAGHQDLLRRLSDKLEGRLGIVSGRSVSNVRALISEPPLIVAGSHGLEIAWPDGRVEAPPAPAHLPAIIAEMQALQARHPGILVEPKPYGVGLHFRRAPDAEEACRACAYETARRAGYEVQPGKMVFEVVARRADKGAAIRTLMQGPAFKGFTPVFLGDDYTDETGFAAVKHFGGAGVLVGPQRETEAVFRLENVAGVLDWLERAGNAA